MGLVARFLFQSVSVVGAVPWANDFFLAFISLRNDDSLAIGAPSF
jgi:hypothetical protein